MRDFVKPKPGQEGAFIEMAERLGFDELVLVYDKLPTSVPRASIKVTPACLIGGKPRKVKGALRIADEPSAVRLAAEHPGVDLLMGMERGQRDFIHHRGSGMNQVIAKLLSRKKKGYLFDLSLIRTAPAKEAARLLGRMAQNLCLMRKSGVSYEIISLARTPTEMCSPRQLRAWEDLLLRL